MLFKTVICYAPSSARRARFKAVRSKQPSQFSPAVKRFKLWRSGPRPLTSFRARQSGASRRWAAVRAYRLFRSRSAFRRTGARKRRLLAQFFYYARVVGRRDPAVLRLYRLTRPIGLLGLLQRHRLRRATFYPLTNAQLLTDYSASFPMGYGRLARPFLLRGSRRPCLRRVRALRRRPTMVPASVRRTLFKAYLAAPLPGRYRTFRAFYAAWLKSDRWVGLRGFSALAVRYNYYSSFYVRRFQRVSHRRFVRCIQILKSVSPLSFVRLPKLRRRRRTGLKNRRGRQYRAGPRFVKLSAKIRFGRSAGFRWYFCCSDVSEDSTVIKWWFALRRRRMLGRRFRRICIFRLRSAPPRSRRKRTRGYRRRRAFSGIRWLRSVRVRTHYRRFRARTKSAKRFASRLAVLRTLNIVQGSYRRRFTAPQSSLVKRLLTQARFFRGLAGMHMCADSHLVSQPIVEASDSSSDDDQDTCDVVSRPTPSPLARAFYAAIRRRYVLRRFNRSGLLLRALTRVYSRARRRRTRNPRFVRAPRNIFHTARRLRWIRRFYYRRIYTSRLLSRRIWMRSGRSKRPRLRPFFRRAAKRRYVSRTRRRGWRNFRRWPNVGHERFRLRRSRARRYNSILRRFVPRLRFRKRRRARRFFRRKQRLVPMTPTGRRRRRLYFTIPRVFKRRSLVYVHITRTVNNVFYSVFSRRQRLLASFSNGRTEFTGSKRMSVVATEVAAKSLAAYLRANKVRYIYFVFTTRFNQFMRAAVRVLRTKKLRIAGFKYTMRRPHSLGLRLRASRRV